MPAPALVASFETQSDIGKSDPETGRVFPPLLLTGDVLVPTTIDRTFTTEVTAALQAVIDSTDDWSRIQLQPASHYYCDSPLVLSGRKGIKIDLNGSTIQSKKKLPFQVQYTGLTILAAGDKGIWASKPPATGSFTLGAAEQLIYVLPGQVPTLGPVTYYKVGDPDVGGHIPPNYRIIAAIKETGYRAAVLASIVGPPHDLPTPGTDLTALFTGTQNSGLSRIAVGTSDAGVRSQHIKICNGHLLGTNTTGVYEADVEGQHAIACQGVDGIEIGPGLELAYIWGDGIDLEVDNPPGPGTILDPRPPGLAGGNACRNVYVHGTEIHHNGRQGISPTGIIGLLVDADVNIHQYPRTGIDIEVTENGVARDVTIRARIFGDGFISIAAYPAHTNAYIDNITLDGVITQQCAVIINNPAPATQRWTNIKFRNIDASAGSGKPFGSGTGFVVEAEGVDGFQAVGCIQYMQFPAATTMFFVHAAQSRGVDVHGNILTCGPPWAPATHYNLSDCVTDGTNAWRAKSAHTSSAAGTAGNQPSVGATSATFWQSLQLDLDAFSDLSARFVTETDISAAVTAVAAPPAKLTASLVTETDLGLRMRNVARLHALLSTETDIAAVVTDVNPPAVLSASFVTETRVAARVRSPRRDVPENEFRTGRGALTGPGWDEEPGGWDTEPWGGTG